MTKSRMKNKFDNMTINLSKCQKFANLQNFRYYINMSDEVENELLFLVAKFLTGRFPEIAEVFIKECEKKKLFPSRIFAKNPSFAMLDKEILPGIPNDQLLHMIKQAIPQSNYPSILNAGKLEIKPINPNDMTMYNIFRSVSPLKDFNPCLRISGHFDKCFCIKIDRSSQFLITAADDFVIKIWKLPEVVLIKSFVRLHHHEITELGIHPANKMFASSGYDGIINIFSLKELKLIKTLNLHCYVYSILFSPCGNYLAAACKGGKVIIYKIVGDDVEEYLSFNKMERDPSWLSFSPGGQFLSVAGDEGLIYVIHVGMKLITRLDGHSKNVTYIDFSKSSSNRFISLSDKERCVKIWTANQDIWGELHNLVPKSSNNTRSQLVKCCWNADNTRIFAIAKQYLYAWDSNTRKLVSVCSHENFLDNCQCIAANPVYPNIVFVGTDIGCASIWDIETRTILSGHVILDGCAINDAVWSDDGSSLYTVDECGGITKFCNIERSNFPTTEMFFTEEIFENVFDENQTIMDSHNVPLEPQPSKPNIKNMHISLIQPTVDSIIEAEEKNLSAVWRRHGSLPLSDLMLRAASEIAPEDVKIFEEEEEDNLVISDHKIYDLETPISNRSESIKQRTVDNSDYEEKVVSKSNPKKANGYVDDEASEDSYYNESNIDEPEGPIDDFDNEELEGPIDDFDNEDLEGYDDDEELEELENSHDSEMDDFIVNTSDDDYDRRRNKTRIDEDDDLLDSSPPPQRKKLRRQTLKQLSSSDGWDDDVQTQYSKQDSDFELSDEESQKSKKKKSNKNKIESDFEFSDEESQKHEKKQKRLTKADDDELELSDEENNKKERKNLRQTDDDNFELSDEFDNKKNDDGKHRKKHKIHKEDVDDEFELSDEENHDESELKVDLSQIERNEEEPTRKKRRRRRHRSQSENPSQDPEFQPPTSTETSGDATPRREHRHRSRHSNEDEILSTQEFVVPDSPQIKRHKSKIDDDEFELEDSPVRATRHRHRD